MYGRKYKGNMHYVYETLDELTEAQGNVDIIQDWRTADLHDWVITDDGNYCQILRKSGIKKDRIGVILTVIGSFPIHKNTLMNSELRRYMHKVTSGSGTRDKRLIHRDKIFINRLLANPTMDPATIALNTYETNDRSLALIKIKHVLASKEGMEMMKKATTGALSTAGVTLVDVIKAVHSVTKDIDSTPKDKLVAAEKLLKLFDAYPDEAPKGKGLLPFPAGQGEISDADFEDAEQAKLSDGK